MTFLSLTLLAFFAFLASIVFSMFGLGGGILYTPLQLSFGIDFRTAIATSLLLITATSFAATVVYARLKKIDWPLVFVLELGAGTGALSSSLSATLISEQVIRLLFSAIGLISGFLMLTNFQLKEEHSTTYLLRHSWQRSLGENRYGINLYLALPLSFIFGSISGLVGVGGGLFTVPLLVLLFSVPMDIAIGCSAAMAMITGLAGFLGHSFAATSDLSTALILTVVVASGGQMGARRSIKSQSKSLRKIFGLLVLVVSIAIWR